MGCVTTAEAAAAQGLLLAGAAKQHTMVLLGRLGIVAPIGPDEREAATERFLRALGLDPIAVLGPEGWGSSAVASLAPPADDRADHHECDAREQDHRGQHVDLRRDPHA